MQKLKHFYPYDSKPFLSLSSLSHSKALEIIHSFSNKEELVYRRFKKANKYLLERSHTEEWLKSEFIKKGGKPKDDYPTYFVLGDSPYVYEGYDQKCQTIEIDLSCIPEDQISFTYPDSMVSKWLSTQQNQIYFQETYHGQVFSKKEILTLMKSLKFPENEWKVDLNRKYDFFVEAQIWDKSLL
ncbi:hypothetical protein MJH12_18940 [bacterium]|nr:hypothetical protein [bacterium]